MGNHPRKADGRPGPWPGRCVRPHSLTGPGSPAQDRGHGLAGQGFFSTSIGPARPAAGVQGPLAQGLGVTHRLYVDYALSFADGPLEGAGMGPP